MYSSSHYCGSSSVLAIHVAITNMRNTSLTAILDCVWVLSDKANRHGRLISINDISSTALEGLALHYTYEIFQIFFFKSKPVNIFSK